MDQRAADVAVINQTMAARYWPGENPLGHRITLGLPRPDNPWITIVGVARDLPHRAIDSTPQPDWYLSRPRAVSRQQVLFVRTAGNPSDLSSAVRAAVAAIDPQQPVTSLRTMSEVIAETTAPRRFSMVLLTIFAALSLVFAALGVYGVISYAVMQRTKEVGIRIALGAQRRDVLRLVLGNGFRLALIGIGSGLVLALVMTRLMVSLLFGITPTDALTFVSVSAVLLLVVLAACYLPARRAARVDPLVALRYE